MSEFWFLLDYNDGTGRKEAMQQPPNGGAGLPKPSREGCEFVGWYTAPIGGGRILSRDKFDKNVKLYAHWAKRRKYQKVQDIWQHTAKEQMSLEMGSEEYLEYLDDIEDHDPMQPDDPMHAELEAENADLRSQLMQADAESRQDTTDKKLARNQMQKRIQAREAFADFRRRAASTETTADDDRLLSADLEGLVYDEGVDLEEHAAALEDMVFGG